MKAKYIKILDGRHLRKTIRLVKINGKLVCQGCGSIDNVEYGFDPYAGDVLGQDVLVRYCRNCFLESCEDI